MFSIKRRRILFTSFAIAASIAVPLEALAYPDRPVKLVVPYAAGGPADIIARILGRVMSDKLKKPVVVESRGGAGGIIGVESVVNSEPDGYTLLLGSVGPVVLQPMQQARRPYDSVKDLDPVALALFVPQAMVASKSLPINSIPELVTYAKTRPGKVSYGSASAGGSTHLAGELFAREAGVSLLNVPYRGFAPALVDLLGGQIDLAIGDLGLIIQSYRRGDVRVVGVMGAERAPQLPDVPTFAEAGLGEVVSTNWYGIFTPAGTDKSRIAIIRNALLAALKEPETVAALVDLGAQVTSSTPEELRELVIAEQLKWEGIIKKLDLSSK